MTASIAILADPVASFLKGVCQLYECDMAVALCQLTPDEVAPLCSVPPIPLTSAPVWSWRLPQSSEENHDAVHRLPRQQLPSLVTAGLPSTRPRCST